MSTPEMSTSRTGRLPAETHIGSVQLRVSDLERALAFYRGHLGLHVVHQSGDLVALGAGEEGQQLIVLEQRQGISRRPSRPRTAGLYHVALLVPSRRDLGRTLIALSESGYRLRGMSDHAVSESLYLDDPDGNGLEIYADRPRELWPRIGDVVQMTVEPMDVEGVLAEAERDPAAWSGLPSGTVIGHVHLTVSRMEPAVEFYRDMIGFDVMMRIPSLTAVSAGGYHHHLNLNTWAGDGAAPDSESVAGLSYWELVVPDDEYRRSLLERLRKTGSVGEADNGTTARDPDGNAFRVMGG
jgi:catechol 2,3-dioxygenase